MSNVVTLHGDKRWKAVLVSAHQNGPVAIEHFLEEISELHNVIEHGPEYPDHVHGDNQPHGRW
ncbi:hypothetical protein NKH10_00025 [Mesorhizobium sp. M1340]|uniref:hypothetical protein n=1 Tax=unclassified Mesorhizobium TaxID=325217 RepID=UPI003337828A